MEWVESALAPCADRFEIMLVNDGSGDRSRRVLDGLFGARQAVHYWHAPGAKRLVQAGEACPQSHTVDAGVL